MCVCLVWNVFVHICLHMWKSDVNFRYLSLYLTPYFETGSLNETLQPTRGKASFPALMALGQLTVTQPPGSALQNPTEARSWTHTWPLVATWRQPHVESPATHIRLSLTTLESLVLPLFTVYTPFCFCFSSSSLPLACSC